VSHPWLTLGFLLGARLLRGTALTGSLAERVPDRLLPVGCTAKLFRQIGFQQRGRDITSEWMVKWYLFWDALAKNRTDGALVRLTTPVQPGDDLKLADQRLIEFAKQVQPLMDQYIPR